MLIDIAILPPKKLRKKLSEKIKKEIGKFPNFFIVDNIKFLPHLSLWHMKISKKVLNDIVKKLRPIAKGQKPIKISSSRFHALERFKGCVEFTIKENEDLAKLQNKVFKNIYCFKSGVMPRLPSFLKIKYSGEKPGEREKYGRSIKFIPHFTMGWLKNEKDALALAKKMAGKKFSFSAEEIYICEINKWWQVKKIMKKISF